jgi:hypothetical protein
MNQVIKYMAVQLSRVALVTAVVASIVVPFRDAHAQAPGICTFGVKTVKNIVVNGNTATATFEIPKGVNSSCAHSLQYSLVAYTAPDASLRPLSSQVLFSSNSANFTPGMHTISTAMPSCGFFQVDLVKGAPIANLNDSGNSYAPQARLITAIGGGQACAAPAAPAAPEAQTPAAPAQVQAQAQQVVVEQKVSQSQTVNNPAPQAPQTPAPVAANPDVGKSLPNTGPGDTAAAFVGISSLSGLAYNFVLRRRAADLSV